ncbi:MAG TPA: hypothetical protein VGH60_09380 [Solirubrobacteraceae bacterium]|jgi:hypothetical protein
MPIILIALALALALAWLGIGLLVLTVCLIAARDDKRSSLPPALSASAPERLRASTRRRTLVVGEGEPGARSHEQRTLIRSRVFVRSRRAG